MTKKQDEYVNERRRRVDDFMSRDWIPKFTKNFIVEAKLDQELAAAKNAEEKTQVHQEFQEAAAQRISERRGRLSPPPGPGKSAGNQNGVCYPGDIPGMSWTKGGKMKTKTIVTTKWLKSEGAGSSVIRWSAPLIGEGLPLEKCLPLMDRADWFLWLLWHAKAVTYRQLVWLTCLCGRLSLCHIPVGEDRPRLAYEAAEAWARNPTEANVRAAETAAEAASWTAGAASRAAAWTVAEAAFRSASFVAASLAAVAAADKVAARTTGVAFKSEHKTMCELIRAEIGKKSFKNLERRRKCQIKK